MEKTITPRPLRNASRRLFAKLGLTMAVLGGGSWATYHFTTQGPEDDPVFAHSADATDGQLDTNELKQLFSSPPPKTADSGATKSRYTLTSSKPDNQLDQLLATAPPVPAVNKTKPAKREATSQPAAKKPSKTTLVGDRYAAMAVSPTPEAPTGTGCQARVS